MKILIACGGSGGHIFPAVALAQSLKLKHPGAQLLFVGSDAALDRRIFERWGFRYRLLSPNKLPYGFSPAALKFFIKSFFDMMRSFGITARFSPDAVIGFGGYVSAQIIFAAHVFGIPSVAHEQNVLPGRANASVFRFADKIAVSFEETRRRLGRFADKAVFTGNPIRASVLKEIDKTLSLKKLGLAPDKFTILVIGGSQGAHNLNSACLKAFAGLDKAKASNIQVIHITGQSDYAWASRSYEDAGIAHRVFSFIDEIEDAYSASDLVITRSGASAMFELAHYAKPMILVPYPFAMSHQAQNASVFSESGAAIKIEEKDISAGVVRNRVESLLSDPALLAGMAGKAKGLSVPDSAQRLAELLLNTAGK